MRGPAQRSTSRDYTSYVTMTENWHEKYRPRNIADFWQSGDHGLIAVTSMLEAGALARLLMFVGAFGCGKTSLARAIGRRFLCINPSTSTGNPCGECEGCMELNNAVSGTIATDGYLEFDASALSANHILDSIRQHVCCNRLTPPPDRRFGGWIVCIDEVVHAEAKLQQSLVKFIENISRARFIICYSDPSRIHPALVSRGLQIRLTPATTDQAAAAIIKIAKAEGFHLENAPARVLVDAVRCLPRDCIKTVELAARLTTGNTITLKAVHMAITVANGT